MVLVPIGTMTYMEYNGMFYVKKTKKDINLLDYQEFVKKSKINNSKCCAFIHTKKGKSTIIEIKYTKGIRKDFNFAIY